MEIYYGIGQNLWSKSSSIRSFTTQTWLENASENSSAFAVNNNSNRLDKTTIGEPIATMEQSSNSKDGVGTMMACSAVVDGILLSTSPLPDNNTNNTESKTAPFIEEMNHRHPKCVRRGRVKARMTRTSVEWVRSSWMHVSTALKSADPPTAVAVRVGNQRPSTRGGVKAKMVRDAMEWVRTNTRTPSSPSDVSVRREACTDRQLPLTRGVSMSGVLTTPSSVHHRKNIHTRMSAVFSASMMWTAMMNTTTTNTTTTTDNIIIMEKK